MQALKAALALEEDNVQTYLKLGFAYEQAKQYEEAIAAFDKAQRYAPQQAQVILLRAAAYTHAAVERKQRAYAEQASRRMSRPYNSIPITPRQSILAWARVYLLALQQPDKAIGHLEKAASSSPRVPEMYRLPYPGKL